MNRHIIQGMILLLTATAAYLGSKREIRIRRWGFLFSVASEPFWFISSWQDKNWAMFGLAVWYLYTHINGIREHWFYKKG